MLSNREEMSEQRQPVKVIYLNMDTTKNEDIREQMIRRSNSLNFDNLSIICQTIAALEKNSALTKHLYTEIKTLNSYQEIYDFHHLPQGGLYFFIDTSIESILTQTQRFNRATVLAKAIIGILPADQLNSTHFAHKIPNPEYLKPADIDEPWPLSILQNAAQEAVKICISYLTTYPTDTYTFFKKHKHHKNAENFKMLACAAIKLHHPDIYQLLFKDISDCIHQSSGTFVSSLSKPAIIEAIQLINFPVNNLKQSISRCHSSSVHC